MEKDFYNKYFDIKKAISVNNIEEAHELLKIGNKFGFKWRSGKSFLEIDHYDEYLYNTCYSLYEGCYGPKKEMLSSHYTIYPFDDFKLDYDNLENNNNDKIWE